MALALRDALLERKRPISCPRIPRWELRITYQLQTTEVVTDATAHRLTFGQKFTRSVRDEEHIQHTHYRRLCRIRLAIIFRYYLHMGAALQSMLTANSRHACASLCIQLEEPL